MSVGAYAVVAAGGDGTRMGLEKSKVFVPLLGIPAIVRAIAPFTAIVSGVVVVARESELADMELTLGGYGLMKHIRAIVPGGATRQASVYRGLKALPPDAETVLVHDGARALVTESIVSRVLKSVVDYGSGVAAVPVTDSIKRAGKSGLVLETIEREGLYAMQTPQGFRVSDLTRAHERAFSDGLDFTDDAALIAHIGKSVYLCEGESENIKLTTRFDITLAESILNGRDQISGGKA